MDIEQILKCTDHTMLSQSAVYEDIKTLCDDAIEYNTASVCIAPSYVKRAKEYVKNKIKICTVVGFPNGYNTIKTKLFETEDALNNGADEIDMVINLGLVKEKNYINIENEIRQIKELCVDKILKVIIETCFLETEEKIKLCEIVTNAEADFIKTSTGFGKSGANLEDIKIFSKYIGKNVKIKAAGGINSLESARFFIEAGASRLGTSKIVKIIKDRKLKNL